MAMSAVGGESDETSVLPSGLEMLDRTGRVVIPDPDPARRETTQTVRDRDDGCAPVLKKCAVMLHENVPLFPGNPETCKNPPSFRSVDGNHGRIGTRSSTVPTNIDLRTVRHDRPRIEAIGRITPVRETVWGTTDRTTC